MVYAASNAIFEVVEDNVCTITINDYCEFEKKLIASDTTKKQVTLQMKITNSSKSSQPRGEVMLVIDNSESMTDSTSTGKVRKDLVFNSAKTLINNLLDGEPDLKIGIVSFSTEKTSEATESDAKLISKLSADAKALTTAIDNIVADGPRTDLESGLDLASKQFSNANTNKYMIILSDGVPNVAIGSNVPYYSNEVISKTKIKLQEMTNSYEVIAMLTGISDPDYVTTNENKYTFSQIIEELFGTTEASKVDKFYYINDSEIEKTITETIYNDLQPASQSLKNLKIVDYFPAQIVENYDFAYVASPNIGNISAKIDTANNSITWTLDELKSGDTAYVQYTLTLKDNYNSNIVGVILDTNEKVDITYKDLDGKDGNKTSNVTPKIRITEPAVTPALTPTTEAPKELPKAGISPLIILAIISLSATGIGLFSGYKFYKLNQKMKNK